MNARQELNCVSTNDLSELNADKINADVVFVSVNPKRMRGTLSDLLNFIRTRIPTNPIVATPFDLKKYANVDGLDVIRFSTTRAIGQNPLYSSLLISSDSSAKAQSVLSKWAHSLRIKRIPDAEFDTWESAYAFCGVAALALKEFGQIVGVPANHPAYKLALFETLNLLDWTDGCPTEAYNVTATPDGIVESASHAIIKEVSEL